jgi:hypothetical protein
MRTILNLTAIALAALLSPIQIASRTRLDDHRPAAAPPLQNAARASIVETLGSLPLAFVENQGQVDRRVRYSARCGGMTTYFTDTAFVMQLVRREITVPRAEEFGQLEPSAKEESISGASVFLTFEGASPDVLLEGRGELPGRYNYLMGNDPSHWHTDVPAYGALRYHGLYPGVDVEVKEHAGRLEYDLLLEPGADLRRIVVRCEGAQSLSLDEDGSLVAATAAGPLTQPKPATYQIGASGEWMPVDCSFLILDEEHFGFEARSWDPHAPLVIDPGLTYSTFLGGSNQDVAFAIAVDSGGAAYVTGQTASSDFPTTPGAFDTSRNGGIYDAFVTKLDASGSALVYSLLFGGSDNELAYGLAMDGAGAACVTGWTDSSDFPTTPGAFDTSFNSREAFVTKFNPCPVTSASNYGTGWPGTLGVPTLTGSPPVLCMQTTVSIGNSLGTTTPAVLIVAFYRASIPTVFGGTLLVLPSFVLPSFFRRPAPACLMSSAVMNSAA